MIIVFCFFLGQILMLSKANAWNIQHLIFKYQDKIYIRKIYKMQKEKRRKIQYWKQSNTP